MAHGIEPILPFDIILTMFLVLNMAKPVSTDELITLYTCQLKKQQDDLTAIHNHILKSQFTSVQQFEWQYENTIQQHIFKPGVMAQRTVWQNDRVEGCPRLVLRERFICVGPIARIRPVS